LSHHAFAAVIGVDPTTVFSWEKDRHRPSGRWRDLLEDFIAEGG
jgi:DNA-binding transcriptional regulator YiaG